MSRESRGPRLAALGRHLGELRDARGLSMSKLGRRIGAKVSTISRLESGERLPSYEMITRVAAALELDDVARADLYVAAGYVPPDGLVVSLAGLDEVDQDAVRRLVRSLRARGGAGGQPAPQILGRE